MSFGGAARQLGRARGERFDFRECLVVVCERAQMLRPRVCERPARLEDLELRGAPGLVTLAQQVDRAGRAREHGGGELLRLVRGALERLVRLVQLGEGAGFRGALLALRLAEIGASLGDGALISIEQRQRDRKADHARDVLSAAYFQSGQLDQALRITDEMIVLDPTDAANHFKRGVLLQQKGRIAGAIQAFSRVVAMAPESEAAEESRAAIEMLDNYQIRQVIARAVEDMPFRLALLRDPAEAVNSRGYVLSERGIMALARVPLADLPPAPPGWRQFMTQ